MAYPLSQMPTLGEFLAQAQADDDIRVGVTSIAVSGPRGNIQYRYLQRGTDAPVILPDLRDDVRLTPTFLSNLCRRLQLTPEKFGLTLGLLPES